MTEISSLYVFVLENKEILKILYGIFILFICSIIVYKSDKLFRLSLYQGIRYFRNAFLFYGLAFLVRYVIGTPLFPMLDEYYLTINLLFEFFLVMAGFFLCYSLVWKDFTKDIKTYPLSSWFNPGISIFYAMSLVIVYFDFFYKTRVFMFFSQIVLFFFVSLISHNNYKERGFRNRFLRFYFIAMVFSFIAWILNFLAALWLNWAISVLIDVYILNMIIFSLVLYGVIVVKRKDT